MRWRPSRTSSDCRGIKGQDTVNRFVIHIYGNGKQLFPAMENSCISYDILNRNGCTQKNEEPSFLCRFPWLCAARSDGASTLRNGSAQTQPAHGTGANSMTHSQRRPLTLTKWPWLERTG